MLNLGRWSIVARFRGQLLVVAPGYSRRKGKDTSYGCAVEEYMNSEMATIRSDPLPIRAAQEVCSAPLVHRPSLKVAARIGSGRSLRRSCLDRDRSFLLSGTQSDKKRLNIAYRATPKTCFLTANRMILCYI
jgi:hypothetical protein